MSEVFCRKSLKYKSALTGPSHAEEVAIGTPTTVLPRNAEKPQTIFKKNCRNFFGAAFRIYVNDDIIGCELGGALNPLFVLEYAMEWLWAYHCSAYYTSGIAEITRLGARYGEPSDGNICWSYRNWRPE